MTKTIAMLACCCTFTAAIAQQNHLKLHLGFELAKRPVLMVPETDNKNVYFQDDYASQPIMAFAFARERANGNFWEVSVRTNAFQGYHQVFDFKKLDSIPVFPLQEIGKERNNFAQLQMDYNWLQCPANDWKVRPYLGLFLRASGQWASFKPSTSANYPVERRVVSLSPGIVPRLMLKLGNRCNLDLSAPIVLGSMGLEHSRIENPVFTPAQQRNTLFSTEMINLNTQVRLGITYRLTRITS